MPLLSIVVGNLLVDAPAVSTKAKDRRRENTTSTCGLDPGCGSDGSSGMSVVILIDANQAQLR